MQKETVNILITDDNLQVRRGLTMRLSSVLNFNVVGVANNGRQAIDLCSKCKPDVILMDVGMPVMDGIEACQRLKQTYADIKVIMLTSHESDDDVLASLAAGADGYCLKESNLDRLTTAINTVVIGDLWLDHRIAKKVQKLARVQKADKGDQKIFEALSVRELEILNLIVAGLSNQEIANKLSIGIETVKTHIKHIMEKMAVDDRTQMAVKALRSGIID